MTLVPAIYRKYQTRIAPSFRGVAPGITSRFEVFGDETYEHVVVSRKVIWEKHFGANRHKEHTCLIEYVEH